RITRGTRPGRARASCTDSTGHRTDGTRGAGIIRRPGPRTGPRLTPLRASRLATARDFTECYRARRSWSRGRTSNDTAWADRAAAEVEVEASRRRLREQGSKPG